MHFQTIDTSLTPTLRAGLALLALGCSSTAQTGFPATQTLALAYHPGEESVTTADLDGDGDLDIVTAQGGYGVVYFLNYGLSGFGGASTLPVSSPYTTQVAAADVDGDGDVDIVEGTHSAVHLHENLGRSALRSVNFAKPATIYVGGKVRRISLEDMDLDGRVDAVVTAKMPNEIVWLQNFGSPAFSGPKLIGSSSHSWLDAVVTDLDGDGAPDIAAVDMAGRLVVSRNRLCGCFSWPRRVTTLAGAGWLQTGDLNGDRRPELLVVQGGNVYACDNRGGGYFFAPRVLAAASAARAADIDGDGALDLVLSSSGVLGYRRNDGAGGLLPFTRIGPAAVDALFAADLDQDGDLELLAKSPSEVRELTVYENRLNSQTSTHQLSDPGSSTWSLILGYGTTIQSWFW